MSVAIIGGTGQLGFGLALRLARTGVDVVIGSRDAGRAEQAATRIRDRLSDAVVSGLENPAAAAAAERIVIVAVPFVAQARTIADLAPGLAARHLLVDATVPLGPAVGGRATQLIGVWHGSAAQQAQGLVPEGVRVVSAFHTLAAAALAGLDQVLNEDTLICGDRKADKREVAALIERIDGIRPLDAGRLEHARLIEGLTPLLIGMNIRYGTHAGIRITGVR